MLSLIVYNRSGMPRFNYRKFRDLILVLGLREIKSRYKGSVLGPIWILAYPLILTTVVTLVFSVFVKIDTGTVPYGYFVLVGVLFWNFISKGINLGTKSLIYNRDIIVGTAVAAEILPLVYILGQLPDVLVGLAALLLLMIISGFSFSISVISSLLLVLLCLVFVYGLALGLSAINAMYKDVQNILEPILLIWFYLTPIVYPPEVVPANLRFILAINPAAHFISSMRQIIFEGALPTSSEWLILIFFSFISLLGGSLVFKKSRSILADII